MKAEVNGDTRQAATYWLLGLPFDLITLEQAADLIVAAARGRRRLVFATPNLNFLRTTSADTAFRDDVLATQLSLVDGTVLVWLGRLLGIPFQERVAGSDLIDTLVGRPRSERISICFLGGAPGAAEDAVNFVSESATGLEAVGAVNPGFGSIEDMSTPAILESINASRADLLCVSLGARKGHAWIELNRARIDAPVISHLGAVVNFLARSVRRAPRWMRMTGLEWLWRIYQEPTLVSRYWLDARWLAQAFVFSALPLLARRITAPLRAVKPLTIVGAAVDCGRLILSGSLTGPHLPTLERACERVDSNVPLVLDVQAVEDIDACALGFLYALVFRSGRRVSVERATGDLRRLIRLHRAECLLGGATAGEPRGQ